MIGTSCLSAQQSLKPNELNIQTLNGIQQLAETRKFKAWFLDQFGVLHDGKQPYPGAISTLEKLGTYGAKMVIISNSSRSAYTTLEKLTSLGFDPSLFAGVVTSGELTHQCLLRRDEWFASLGRSCIHITWSDKGAISLEIIYKSAMEMVGVDSPDSYIAFGDSFHHDIKGANAAGIAPAFITSCGVHATELRLNQFGQVAGDDSVRALALKYDAYPTYVLPSFSW